MADVSGYTDYGRVWREFLEQVEDDLHPRATVIVLGDARTNGRDPRADVFARVAERAGRTFWLNPEPRLYWNYGDSVISAYEQLLRSLRVLDDTPARGLRQGAHAPDARVAVRCHRRSWESARVGTSLRSPSNSRRWCRLAAGLLSALGGTAACRLVS